MLPTLCDTREKDLTHGDSEWKMSKCIEQRQKEVKKERPDSWHKYVRSVAQSLLLRVSRTFLSSQTETLYAFNNNFPFPSFLSSW